LKMRFSTLVAATLAAAVSAEDFFWKHDSEWATDANWNGGAKPGANAFAAFGVSDSDGSEDACARMDAVVNIPDNAVVQSGGIVLGKGVEIQLGKGGEIEMGKTTSNDVVQWKCKSEIEVDYRCSANWLNAAPSTGVGEDVANVPCGQDNIYFEKASFNVDNAGVPLVKSVTINSIPFDTTRKIGEITKDFRGFKRSFVATESFSTDPASEAAAALECFDSCPGLNMVMLEGEDEAQRDARKYSNNHNRLILRQEFLTQARAQIGDNVEVVSTDPITTSEQKKRFGRATLYVFKGQDKPAKVQVGASTDDVNAFTNEVVENVDAHFKQMQNMGGCLRPGNKAFSFHPDECVALMGFSGDKVNACVDGNNLYNDECPKNNLNSMVCPHEGNTHINVATRFAIDNSQFADVTCGEFEDISVWYSASDNIQRAVTEKCCELREHVAVIGCDFTTDDMQVGATVEMFGESLVATTKHLLHGVNRGARKADDSECRTSYIAADSDLYLPINLNAASGEFLAAGDNEDLDTDIAVAAVATPEMAQALADWDLSSKAEDFDMKFHVKKFRGQDPDNGRRRRNFKAIKDQIEERLQNEMPFGKDLTIDTMVGGTNEDGHDAQLLIKGFSVRWFEANNIATIKPAAIEKYVADILLSYAMEAYEYILKQEEYDFLTTSTTTTATTTRTETTTTTVLPAEASGIPGYVSSEKEGTVLCRVTTSPCPEDRKVKTVSSMVSDAKEVFDIEAAAAQNKIDSADLAIANLRDDMATKSAIYKSMKVALDKCDKAGVDKISSMAYPNGCEDEKAAYDKASQDFISFVGGSARRSRRGLDFDGKISKIYQDKGIAMSELSQLQADHFDEIYSMINYDAAAHGTEDTASYKQPEEVKDMQTSFGVATAQIDALTLQIESTQRELSKANKENSQLASTEKSALEKQQKELADDVSDCNKNENTRLADVPSPVLTEGSAIYKEEVELKVKTIGATCSPFSAELAAIEKQLENNAAKFASLKAATEEAFTDSVELSDSVDEFEETGKSAIQASLNTRVAEDEAFPLLIIVIAGAGALVLVLLVALIISSTGNSARGKAYGGGDQWGAGGGGGGNIAFENPVYDDNGGPSIDGNFVAGDGGDDEEDDGGLYDEPEMFADGEGPAADGAGAGGGYLDVEPEEDDDDEEDEEESEEDEEEDDEEEDEEDDEDDDDDDEDDDEDEDSDE